MQCKVTFLTGWADFRAVSQTATPVHPSLALSPLTSLEFHQTTCNPLNFIHTAQSIWSCCILNKNLISLWLSLLVSLNALAVIVRFRSDCLFCFFSDCVCFLIVWKRWIKDFLSGALGSGWLSAWTFTHLIILGVEIISFNFIGLPQTSFVWGGNWWCLRY